MVPKRVPIIRVDAFEKVPGYFDDSGDRYTSCAADQMACELDNSGRAESSSGGYKYMHPVSIGGESTEHREQIARGLACREQSTDRSRARLQITELAMLALCSVLCALCSVLCALCSVFCVLLRHWLV